MTISIAFLQSCYRNLRMRCLWRCKGILFISSTTLDVCLNHRIHTHKVSVVLAVRGKTSIGCFFGFKLHLVVIDRGGILWFFISPVILMTTDRLVKPARIDWKKFNFSKSLNYQARGWFVSGCARVPWQCTSADPPDRSALQFQLLHSVIQQSPG